jgi:ABC-type transport system involved in multi-copper enzyme maturation permease subunit
MTTTTARSAGAPTTGSSATIGLTRWLRVVRGELLKIRTLNIWWLFGIAALVTIGLALLTNSVSAHFDLNPTMPTASDFSSGPNDPNGGKSVDFQQAQADAIAQRDHARSPAGLANLAANIYTSGQFFGLLFVLLLGIIVVTNEFFHQTATTTFLTTPRRTAVILAKLATGMTIAAVFWLFTTVIDVVTGSIFFASEGVSTSLGRGDVTRALLLNLLAYALWAVFGVGIGVLLRSQIGAVVTGAVLYLLSFPLAFAVFGLVHEYLIKKDWVLTAMVSVPSLASTVMISTDKPWDQAPQQWVGAVVLIGYGVAAGAIGTLITRKRDIS